MTGDAEATRTRVRGRGTFAKKRLELPLAGIRKASGLTQVDVAAGPPWIAFPVSAEG
jgi:hypothetical protein